MYRTQESKQAGSTEHDGKQGNEVGKREKARQWTSTRTRSRARADRRTQRQRQKAATNGGTNGEAGGNKREASRRGTGRSARSRMTESLYAGKRERNRN